jgi:hypothetical protein
MTIDFIVYLELEIYGMALATPSITNWTAIARTIIVTSAVMTRRPSSPKSLNNRDEYLIPVWDIKIPNSDLCHNMKRGK